ncbi:ATP-binding protein [Streptosporangium lutulentum]
MAQVPWWRGNLPAEMSGFIGHESEVRRLLRLLPEAPLITVIGAGGVGKSRIAVKAAEECRDSYSGGAWLVELSGEHNGDLLAHTVAAALGLCEQSARSQIEVLVEFLADKELLLLLDACEHLLPACRGLAADILAAAPGVRIVATSRQALELPQETLLFVEPFEVPEPGAVTPDANDALRFLLDRAGTAVPPWRWARRSWRPRGGSAGGWTASRSPWSWPPNGSGPSRWNNSPISWRPGSAPCTRSTRTGRCSPVTRPCRP